MKKEKKTLTKQEKKELRCRRGKKAGKILGIIALVLVVMVGALTLVSVVGNRSNLKKALSFAPVELEDRLLPQRSEDGSYYFTTDREFKLLQLTDVHIGGGWMSLKKDAMALNAVAAMVTAEKPDLVVVTGDIAYPVPFQSGTFNNKESAKIFAALMEQLGVYWTLTLGNHDTEAYSYFSREEIGALYSDEKYSYCLFDVGPEEVDGCGNHYINVQNSDGIITQTLFMFDSHSYTDGDFLGIMWKYDNIHQNQIDWYAEALDRLNAQNEAKSGKKSDIKSLAFFHIPLTEQKAAFDAYAENGYKDTDEVKLVYGTAGETGKVVYCGMHEDELFETMLEKGSTKGCFFGHDHKNSLSFDYKGIRLTYGMSVDYLAYPGIYKLGSQRGCTLITVLPDGSFTCEAFNYYSEKYTSLYEKEAVELG